MTEHEKQITLSAWFQHQLTASADGFVWGAEQLPREKRYIAPPSGLGEWSAARHVFHMVYYEEYVALPSMRQWLGGPAIVDDDLDENKAWGTGQDIESLVRQFRQVRDQQISLLPEFDEHVWHETRLAAWGEVTLLWVVSKTFQHTAEHTHDVMRMVLFWDRYAARESRST